MQRYRIYLDWKFSFSFDYDDWIPHLVGLRNGILDIELARESLDVGKGINFIRRCLRDKDWNIDLKMIYDGEDGATDTAKRKLDYYYNPTKNDNRSLSL